MNKKKLFIPPLGTELKLADDWAFDLYLEGRNSGLIRALKVDFDRGRVSMFSNLSKKVTLPADTVLTVRSYFVRQGGRGKDSVTFSAKVGDKSHRFWARLDDVNRICVKA